MDIGALSIEHEKLPLIHPDSGEDDVVLTVCSPMGKEFNANRARLVYDANDGDAYSAFVINQALCAIVGWEGITANGEPVEFSREKLKELLDNPNCYWIANAVDEHYGKKKGYLQMLKNRLKPT